MRRDVVAMSRGCDLLDGSKSKGSRASGSRSKSEDDSVSALVSSRHTDVYFPWCPPQQSHPLSTVRHSGVNGSVVMSWRSFVFVFKTYTSDPLG